MAVTCCYAKKIWHLLDFKISSQIIYSWSNYEMAVIISITSLKKLYLFFSVPKKNTACCQEPSGACLAGSTQRARCLHIWQRPARKGC